MRVFMNRFKLIPLLLIALPADQASLAHITMPVCLANRAAGACGHGYPICKICWPKLSVPESEVLKAAYNASAEQPYCSNAECWMILRQSGVAREVGKCHACYSAQPADTRSAARSRSPHVRPGTDAVAELVTEMRRSTSAWRDRANPLIAAADRLEALLSRVDSERNLSG